jgi:hypothetical protein
MVHWLESILSMEEFYQEPSFRFVENHILKLRAVSSTLKNALENNRALTVNIRLGQVAAIDFKTDFLTKWKGRLNFFCEHDCQPRSLWLNEIIKALSEERITNLNVLGLAVNGQNLKMLADAFVPIMKHKKAIGQLRIEYVGQASVLGADVLQNLGRAAVDVRVDLYCIGRDSGGQQACEYLPRLNHAGIATNVLSLRLVLPCLKASRRSFPNSPHDCVTVTVLSSSAILLFLNCASDVTTLTFILR